jgi:hypothetical protein
MVLWRNLEDLTHLQWAHIVAQHGCPSTSVLLDG